MSSKHAQKQLVRASLNVTGVLEKEESFKLHIFNQDLSYQGNTMLSYLILYETELLVIKGNFRYDVKIKDLTQMPN